MTKRIIGLLCVVSLSLISNLRAEDDTTPIAILIPTYSAVPRAGLNGALWTFELFARNENDTSVAISAGGDCMIPFCSTPEINPHTTTNLRMLGMYGPAGLLYLQRAGAEDVHLSLRISNANRPGDTGSEIPIVREERFLTHDAQLLNVPVDTASRIDLRLYDPRAIEGTALRVRVFAMDTDDLLADFTVTFAGEGSAAQPPQKPVFPGYAEIGSLADRFPALRTAERLRIRITPVSDGAVFWAFASVIENATNEIHIISPQ